MIVLGNAIYGLEIYDQLLNFSNSLVEKVH